MENWGIWTSEARLDEYTMEEWWDVMRLAVPDIDRQGFEEFWAEFQANKAERLRLQSLH